MTQITLTAEQTQAILQAAGPVFVVDAQGRNLGTLGSRKSAWSPAEWEALERDVDADLPCVPSEEVLRRLRELEERR